MPPAALLVVAAIVTVAAGVAQISAAKKQEKNLKAAAQRQATIETEKLDITTEKREIDTSREQSRLKRETRRKQAVVQSRALSAGIRGSSIARSGTQALASVQKRELDFIKQTNDLAERADATTAEQIALDAATARQRASTVGLQGTIAGATTITKGISSGTTSGIGDIFKSGDA